MATSHTSASSERDDVDALKQLVSSQAARIAILEEKLRLATVKTFAPKSEKLSALAQFDLFNEAEHLGGASDAHAASAQNAQEIKVPEHARARGKRKPIDASLPRVRIEHDIPAADKKCPCGCKMSRICEVTSEQMDIEPAKARVLQHVRFKYVCRTCDGTSVVPETHTEKFGPAVATAPMPAQPLPKSNASPALAAFITASKFADGLPLYRLEGILARYRIALSRTTWPSG